MREKDRKNEENAKPMKDSVHTEVTLLSEEVIQSRLSTMPSVRLHCALFLTVFFLLSVTHQVAAENVYWSAPTTIGIGKVTPVIGVLSDGKVAIASVNGRALMLGIYSASGHLIRDIEVESNNVASIRFPAISRYEATAWDLVPELDIDTNNGKITIAYQIPYYGSSDYGSFFKQYTSDGQLLIDKTRITPDNGGTSLKIAVTPNGEVHTLYKTVTAVYQRFSATGQPIGNPITIPYSDGGYIKEVDLALHSDNTVTAGLLVNHNNIGTLIFLRKITDGVLGPEWLIQTSLYWCPGYLPRAAQCRVDGMSIATDRGNEYISAFVAGYRGIPYGSIEWSWSPVLIKVTPQAPEWRYVSGSGWSTRPITESIWNPDIIPRTQIVSVNGEKWMFWSDRRNGDMGAIYGEKLGLNDEIIVDDALVQFTGNEDYVAAAVDAAGTPYVAYMNGFLRKKHAASEHDVVSFFTTASTSSISLAGSPTPGSTMNIDFSNPVNAGKSYIAYASATLGHTQLGNGGALPVQLDPLFFLSVANPTVLFSNAQGTLDSAGNTRIGLRIHQELLSGVTFYVGVVVFETDIKHISFPLRIVVEEEIA